jgi:hypothetical protein
VNETARNGGCPQSSGLENGPSHMDTNDDTVVPFPTERSIKTFVEEAIAAYPRARSPCLRLWVDYLRPLANPMSTSILTVPSLVSHWLLISSRTRALIADGNDAISSPHGPPPAAIGS